MEEDLKRLEDKIDKIHEKLVDMQVRNQDIVWIKNVAKFLIPFMIAFGAWVTTNIMELQANVAALPVLQRDKSVGSDDHIE